MATVASYRLELLVSLMPGREAGLRELAAGSMAGWFGTEQSGKAGTALVGLKEALESAAGSGTPGEAATARGILDDMAAFLKPEYEGLRGLMDTSRMPDITLPEEPCAATIKHGPGHQSRSRCDRRGIHDLHHARGPRDDYYWKGDEGCSGYFDESPLDEDGEAG